MVNKNRCLRPVQVGLNSLTIQLNSTLVRRQGERESELSMNSVGEDMSRKQVTKSCIIYSFFSFVSVWAIVKHVWERYDPDCERKSALSLRL